jgi:hypothetical protein
MPNWCQNVVIITGEETEQLDLIRNAVKKASETESGENFFNELVPRPESENENWYNWNVSNWGTKWDVEPIITEDTGFTITLSFDSAWAPPIEFCNKLVELGFNVLAYYNEEGMCFAGIFDNGSDDYYEYSDMNSAEVSDTLPSDLDEMFGISQNMAEWECDNEENNDEE